MYTLRQAHISGNVLFLLLAVDVATPHAVVIPINVAWVRMVFSKGADSCPLANVLSNFLR
jgi:hypothetical protein